jgi:hypothetical protein
MILCDNTGSKAAPFTGQQLPVHTQPFAFRAHEEDDESVKMSNTISRRTSAAIPALPAALPRLKHAQNSNFYSIQMNGFSQLRILQPIAIKALPFFYSVQMKSHQSLLTDRQSLITSPQSPIAKTRRTP